MTKRIMNQYEPDVVSPPGETLQETLDALGMTQAELAERTGRPKKTINEIIKGKAAITQETALQLERVLDVPASFWNNRELQYREFLARQRDAEHLSQCCAWLRQFPIALMSRLGWIKKHSDELGQLKETLRFFGIASPDQWQSTCQAAFRKSSTSKAPALSVWLRQGQLEGQKKICSPFEAEKFKEALAQARAWTLLEPSQFVPKLVDECAHAGVAVVFLRELPGSSVSGATRWLSQTKALLQLSLRYKCNDQLWFTFFHEAGHILLHGRSMMFLEGDDSNEYAEKEAEANKFAADFLIPPSALQDFLERHPRPSANAVSDFARKVGIAPGIVVGRLQHEKRIPFSHLNHLKVRLAWTPSA